MNKIHDVKKWLSAQIETFAMFGYELHFFFPDGEIADLEPLDYTPVPTQENMENAFKFWKSWGMAHIYADVWGDTWALYPIVDGNMVILWIAFCAPRYQDNRAVENLAEAYLEDFVR